MKKVLSFLAVGALAFTACTSEEVVDESVQSNAIGFTNVVNKSSRALDTDGLTTFYVYGFYTKQNFETSPVTVFDGDKVTGSGSTWSYGTNYRYWVPDATYKFFAYSCENNESALSTNGQAGMTFDDYGIPTVGIDGFICNDSHQHDLIFAKNDGGILGKQSGNAQVPFNFKHILSKIKVKFVSEFPAGYDLKISAVQVSNVYGKADFTLSYGDDGASTSWAPSQGVTANTILNIAVPNASNTASAKNGEAAAVDAVTSEAYVIPHDYTTTNVGIRFRVDITNGETEVMSRVFTGSWQPKWKEGTAYTYTIKISGETASLEKIEFGNMNVGDWTEAAGPTLTFGAPTNPNN